MFLGFLSRRFEDGSRRSVRSKVELFAAVVDHWKLLNIFAKASIF